MKPSLMRRYIAALCLWLCHNMAFAQPADTVFTYQGRLETEATMGAPLTPANGAFDFIFRLFSNESGSNSVGSPTQLNDITVNNGVFTVPLDFGSDILSGGPLWLGISVRDANDNGAFTPLTPNQKITSTPYAVHAEFVPMNSIGNIEVNANQVQLRVSESCTLGFYMTAINQDGSINCMPVANNTDEQTLSLNGSQLAISNGNSVDLSGVSNDNDATNEHNINLALNNETLELTDGGGTLQADLSSIPNSANEILTKLGTVDGPGSQLNADLLDGMQASDILASIPAGVEFTAIDSLPFTIAQPGYYIATQNLVLENNGSAGISIVANDVVIDLAGYSITRSAGVTTPSAIRHNTSNNITIMNGAIHGWSNGIHATSSNYARFINLKIYNNSNTGIRASHASIFKDVVVYNNDAGIFMRNDNTLINVIARDNTTYGIQGLARNSIYSTTATENGEDGLSLNDDNLVQGGNYSKNGRYGLTHYNGGRIRGVTANENGSNGIYVQYRNQVVNSVANNNGTDASLSDILRSGINARSDNKIDNNYVADNEGHGMIISGFYNVVDNNYANDNNQIGITAIVQDNLFIRNRASANAVSNFSFSLSAHGPIVDVDITGSLENVTNADHPLANLEF
ncbi:MAG: right-handed parallel beta-helix repeat-containing protein [Xanthomonadales bacterium]|nr:right-handed parallel beta-helix repeat-containing protein [Xanthomonadales bacterium]